MNIQITGTTDMKTGKFHRLTALILALTGSFLLPLSGIEAYADETPQAITLTLGDYRFDPDTLEVRAGQPVALTLINKDGITPHTVILKDTAAGLDIDTGVSAGSTTTIEFTAEAPGTYTFYCSKKLPFMKSHRERGMEGTLTVR